MSSDRYSPEKSFVGAKFKDTSRFPEGSAIEVEPRRGTPLGQPDWLVLLGSAYVPIELKWSDKHGIQPEFLMRPSQRRFCGNVLGLGGSYLVLVGVGTNRTQRNAEAELYSMVSRSEGQLLARFSLAELTLEKLESYFWIEERLS